SVAGVYDTSRTFAERLTTLVNNCRAMPDGQQVVDAADLIFITTPDDAIEEVVSNLKWTKKKSVVHCSGANSTDILESARKSGAVVGSFHPLQTFAGVQEAIENMPGSSFAIEAEEPLLSLLQELAESLNGSWILLKAGDKAAYHAAAVFVSNYLVTLMKMATDLWKTFSIPSDQATKALIPLMQGTLHNIESIGLPQCLTGPISRNDIDTIRKHLQVIREKTPELLFPYKELGLQTIPIALAKGKINKKQARELELILRN
ncbi:MAG: Rossmann-like and DUF2520 domain-containing protein, partial [Dehalococcoidales bacterium]